MLRSKLTRKKEEKGRAQTSSSSGLAGSYGSSSDSGQASASSRNGIKVHKINDSLCVLEEPEPPSAPEIDIVFFHGFHSSDSLDMHLKTWEVLLEDGPCIWPSTWLAESFPKARVLYVSYDAVLVKSSQERFDLHIIAENLASDFMQANIGQTPNCPVVLVGHCFGGLVIKQLCLHISRNISLERFKIQRTKLENFLSRVKGVFYYGTPHRGSVEKAHDLRANPLLEYFKILSKEASRINSTFSHLCSVHAEWQIQGLGESIPTNQGLFKGMVVASEACSRDGNEFNVVAADHISITKPESKTDRRFYALTGLLDRIVTNTEVEVLGHQCQGLPDYPMELEKFAQEVKKNLLDQAIVGIVGMGGIGKTTIAKKVYNNISAEFEYTCFLENVKVILKSGLEDFICSHFYKSGKIAGKIQWEHLKKMKTLIVMDDVDNEDQLVVLPKLHHMGDGSKIIITSRDKQVLGFYEKYGIYEVDFLEMDVARRLFCRHTFGLEDIPGPNTQPKHLQDYVTKVVGKCDGLPLTLEVMGRYLRNHTTNANIWKETINRLENAQAITGDRNDRVWASLRVSYDALLEGEQKMFIEAGTIFAGRPLNNALAGWSTAIGSPETSWANLINRSMVKVYSTVHYSTFIHKTEETIWVHEQLQDLAKKLANGTIISASSLEAEEIITMLNANKVNENTTSLSLHHTLSRPQIDSFVRLKNLRYLDLERVGYEGPGENFPRNLSMLRWSASIWDGSSLFPISINDMNNLAYLQLQDWDVCEGWCKALGSLSNLRILRLQDLRGLDSLPEDLGNLSHLKELHLSDVSLPRLPESLGKLSALEELVLYKLDCSKLPESFGNLSSLVRLQIEYCDELASLPASFGRRLDSLKYLVIVSCPRLECLPHSFSQLQELQELVIDGCFGLKELGDSFGNLSALQLLTLTGCRSIVRLPKSVGHLPSLQELYIDCIFLVKLPKTLGFLTSLQKLIIKSYDLKRLPQSLGELAGLKYLEVGLHSVTALPESLGKLSSVLETLMITGTSLESLPNNIGQLSSLQLLFIDCNCLEKVPESLGDLSSLEKLYVGSKRLKSLPESVGRLQAMRVFTLCAESVMTLPESIGQLTSLQVLQLWCEKLERLPDSLDHLPLSSLALSLSGEHKRPTLPKGLGKLSTLGDLTLDSFQFRRLPEEIEKLSSLRSLSIIRSESLESLPDSLGCIPSLRKLVLDGCEELITLPDSLRGPMSSKVAIPREQGRDEKVAEKPPSQPLANKGLRLEIRQCTYLEEPVMRRLGWVLEKYLRDGGKRYRRENAVSQASSI